MLSLAPPTGCSALSFGVGVALGVALSECGALRAGLVDIDLAIGVLLSFEANV